MLPAVGRMESSLKEATTNFSVVYVRWTRGHNWPTRSVGYAKRVSRPLQYTLNLKQPKTVFPQSNESRVTIPVRVRVQDIVLLLSCYPVQIEFLQGTQLRIRLYLTILSVQGLFLLQAIVCCTAKRRGSELECPGSKHCVPYWSIDVPERSGKQFRHLSGRCLGNTDNKSNVCCQAGIKLLCFNLMVKISISVYFLCLSVFMWRSCKRQRLIWFYRITESHYMAQVGTCIDPIIWGVRLQNAFFGWVFVQWFIAVIILRLPG